MCPFHCIRNGTRIPPSHVCDLKPRRGPFPEVIDGVGPPLSLRNTMSVSFSSPRSRTVASTVPMASSIADSIAANVRRLGSEIAASRSSRSGVACSGAWTALKAR